MTESDHIMPTFLFLLLGSSSSFGVITHPQADSSLGHRDSSVTQSVQDIGANLEPPESANCVYLDSNA